MGEFIVFLWNRSASLGSFIPSLKIYVILVFGGAVFIHGIKTNAMEGSDYWNCTRCIYLQIFLRVYAWCFNEPFISI